MIIISEDFLDTCNTIEDWENCHCKISSTGFLSILGTRNLGQVFRFWYKINSPDNYTAGETTSDSYSSLLLLLPFQCVAISRAFQCCIRWIHLICLAASSFRRVWGRFTIFQWKKVSKPHICGNFDYCQE